MKTIHGSSVPGVLQKGSPIEALRGLMNIYQTWLEYQRVCEEEQTKRREIEAWEKTRLAEIEAKREFFLNYVEKAFAERKANFSSLFAAVDTAMADGNTEQLALCLHSITELAGMTPFRDLVDAERTREALGDSNHVWEL